MEFFLRMNNARPTWNTRQQVNVHEKIVPIQQNLLGIQRDIQREEARFAQINQSYQQFCLPSMRR